MNFKKEIKIADKVISNDSPVFIIAEAGVNHDGDMEKAKKLIDIAVEAKVDAVKFQAFKSEELILENVKKAQYQKQNTGEKHNQFEMLKKLEISLEDNEELQNYCKERNIIFLTTPFDEVSLDQLDSLDLPAYKVSSTDTTNIPFLRKVASKGKPIIISSGMSYFSEVEKALSEIHKINTELVLLQCTANYPVSFDEVNLNVLNTYKENFDILIGYSDHSEGVGAAPYAIPMGAKVIEKHFTLDKTLDGPDHKASLDPNELKEFVSEIRKVELMMGTGVKAPTISEINSRASLQKCIVARKDISEGEVFSVDNLSVKRTGGKGLSPMYFDSLLGTKSSQSYLQNEIVTKGQNNQKAEE